MAASLPPSSSTTGLVVAAAAAMTAWPVPTPPVKETMSTPGWPTNAAPSRAAGPFTTLRTPGGSTSAMAAATSSTVPGHDGGALTTTVSPASRAGSTLLPMTDTGQLKGSTAATTPWGTHSIRVDPPLTSRGASAWATRGAKATAMPPMVAVSKIASRCVLPCSRVRRRARSWRSTAATPASAAATTIAAALAGSSAAQARWDRRAAPTARSSCAGEVDGASSTTSAGRAGFVTGYVPSPPGTEVAVDEQARRGC